MNFRRASPDLLSANAGECKGKESRCLKHLGPLRKRSENAETRIRVEIAGTVVG